jgi:hemerythrin-like domain-containing protein
MPVQIGAGVHSYSDPTGLLSDCHRRIEMFLASLQAVAKVIDRPPTSEAARALDSALRYFREAAPKHTADEEESLFPRLRRMGDPDVQSALTSLDTLEKDHRWAEPLHAEVEHLGKRYLAEGSLSQPEVEAFRDAVTRLATMYQEHIRVEDTTIFPLAARLLSHADQTSLGLEMAARRTSRPASETPTVHIRK